MRRGRAASTTTLLATGQVLVAGGCGAEVPSSSARAGLLGTCPATATAELYDPAAGTFGATGTMSTRRVAHSATRLADGRVLIAGGRAFGVGDDGQYRMLASAELYDPTTGEFRETGAMGTGRAQHTATLLADGRVLVAGGIGHLQDGVGLLTSAELFDPGSGTFSPTGAMGRDRAGHGALLLGDGRVFLWPGNDLVFLGPDPSSSGAELYDPGAGVFDPASETAPWGPATLLADGRVLIVGDGTSDLYDPSTGTYRPTGPPPSELRAWGSAATLLTDGSVLLSGGWPDGDAVARAERYDPVTGTFASAGSMVEVRWRHSATLLPGGAVLLVGSGESLWTNARPYAAASPTAELYFPDAAGRTRSISMGGFHAFAIRQNGVLWAWGANGQGQLGDGTRVDRASPVRIGDGFTAVSAGGAHTLAVKSDGTLWAWGSNSLGQVGDGSVEVERTAPVQIGSGFAEVAAGAYHSLAVKWDGSLWAWGGGSGPSSPTWIGERYAAVSAGHGYSLALKVDGTLWAWGENGCGELGDGTFTARTAPVQVESAVFRVAAGAHHALAVKRDGTLWAWGCNWAGQLGDGTLEPRPSPVRIGEGFVRVAAGQDRSMGVKADGTLWAWGDGRWLGEERASLVPALLDGGYVAVAAGGASYQVKPHAFSAATRSDGTVWMWGNDCLGQPRTRPLFFPGHPVMFR